MKIMIPLHLLMICFLLFGKAALVSGTAAFEAACSPGAGAFQGAAGMCGYPDNGAFPALTGTSLQLLLPLQGGGPGGESSRRLEGGDAAKSGEPAQRTVLYFFRGRGCPHCEDERRFLAEMKRTHPSLEIREYEVWYDAGNAVLMERMLRAYGVSSSGVPVTFVGGRLFSGFTVQTGGEMEKAIEKCRSAPCGDPVEMPGYPGLIRNGAPAAQDAFRETGSDAVVTIPAMGPIDVRTSSLPLLTLVIAGMDSFNPCAFFVLLSLLGLLIHARSRAKMFLIGAVFVFFSGGIYFLFMAAWLNLFLVMGHVTAITTIAGCVSLIIAGINIKDFFLFKQGISLTLPDSARPKLLDRMRRLLRSASLVPILAGASVLAVVANFYELLCTAGFPLVFTRILTLSKLPTPAYYLYLALYNVIYVIPLLLIVLGFTATLGKRQLSEWQGRVLKLVSGTMMLGLGAVLVVNPALLNSVAVSIAVPATALAVSLLVAAAAHKRGGAYDDGRRG